MLFIQSCFKYQFCQLNLWGIHKMWILEFVIYPWRKRLAIKSRGCLALKTFIWWDSFQNLAAKIVYMLKLIINILLSLNAENNYSYATVKQIIADWCHRHLEVERYRWINFTHKKFNLADFEATRIEISIPGLTWLRFLALALPFSIYPFPRPPLSRRPPPLSKGDTARYVSWFVLAPLYCQYLFHPPPPPSVSPLVSSSYGSRVLANCRGLIQLILAMVR